MTDGPAVDCFFLFVCICAVLVSVHIKPGSVSKHPYTQTLVCSCFRSPRGSSLKVRASINLTEKNNMWLAHSSSTFLCKVKAEHAVLGWFVQKEAAENH